MIEPKKWEYRVSTAGSTFSQPKEDDLQEMLSEWGAEGWEVVAVHNLEGTNKIRLIAKRPLSGSVQRKHTWSY